MTDVYYPTVAVKRILDAIGITDAFDDVNTGVLAGGATLMSVDTAPPTTFVTPLVVDTTNKISYVWNGAAYIKLGDYA